MRLSTKTSNRCLRKSSDNSVHHRGLFYGINDCYGKPAYRSNRFGHCTERLDAFSHLAWDSPRNPGASELKRHAARRHMDQLELAEIHLSR